MRKMRNTRFSHGLALVFFCLAFCPVSGAAEPIVEDLSPLDRQYMQQQRDLVGQLVEARYGTRFSGARDHDIALLQRLLDGRVVRNDQTRELQAMGFILGDLLAAEYGLHWVVYKDELGRSHALRYRETPNYLFPVTMISRRREVDNRTPVAEIYAKAAATIGEAIPALPYH